VTDLEDLIGERLMIGLPGATLDDADIRLFRDTRAAASSSIAATSRPPRSCSISLAASKTRSAGGCSWPPITRADVS